MDGIDPNGAHALPIDHRCPLCGAELAHPTEVRMGFCFPCSAKCPQCNQAMKCGPECDDGR